ncbi:MAG TPA: hypothetical protein DCK76_06145 [Desulfotomaculum sp.]|nr:MAG: Pyridoxamine 5'-phosphate oxidase-like protein [Desulfotomaculum sp. 46_296]HAG10955.1 hypothetical protein [Desulfotomaculum sp.]HBY04320.1 hypothetical protein [Desulfotomaculum sp.]
MEKVLVFLKENPVFYFATEEGDQPKVRPFGFFMEYEGKLYFSMGRHKKVYRQILENPNAEICTASAKGEWIRILYFTPKCYKITSFTTCNISSKRKPHYIIIAN